MKYPYCPSLNLNPLPYSPFARLNQCSSDDVESGWLKSKVEVNSSRLVSHEIKPLFLASSTHENTWHRVPLVLRVPSIGRNRRYS